MAAMQRSSGSAAQPALDVITPAKRIQDVTSEQLAGYSNFYRLGFYNIGWNIASRKHSKEISQDFSIGDLCAVVVCTRKLMMFPLLI